MTYRTCISEQPNAVIESLSGFGGWGPSIVSPLGALVALPVSQLTHCPSGRCQGASKTGSICDVWVPAELQCIYKGSLKGNGSLLNAGVEVRRKLPSHSTQVRLYITDG